MLQGVALFGVFLLAVACAPAVAPTDTPTPAVPTPVVTPTLTPQVTPAPPPDVTPALPPLPTPATPTPGAPVGDGVEVSIVDRAFRPPTLEVPVGTTVTWTNTGQQPHTVTFEDEPQSGVLDTGGTFRHTFASPGTFSYVCLIHSGMRATVTVSL